MLALLVLALGLSRQFALEGSKLRAGLCRIVGVVLPGPGQHLVDAGDRDASARAALGRGLVGDAVLREDRALTSRCSLLSSLVGGGQFFGGGAALRLGVGL